MKLIHRMKVLMAVLQELGGHFTRDDFHKLLFLYCNKYVENNLYYEFIPQSQGPFSLQAEADKKVLKHKKLLEDSADWMAYPNIDRYAIPLDFFEKIGVQQLKNAWKDKGSEELCSYLKLRFPHYFACEKDSVENGSIVFFTIGYEGRSLEAYLNILREQDVRLLCDVRKNAFSQKYGFSKGELTSALVMVGIEYRHIPDLGIVSQKRQNLNNYGDYKALFDEYEQQTLATQQDKIELLLRWLEEHKRIAITCFEASVHHCHRSRVALALKAHEGFNYQVRHL